MSYDLEILVQNQKKPSILPFESSIEMLNEKTDRMTKRYHSMWKYMTCANGIWYSLVSDYEGVYNAYSICTSDFKADNKEIIPYWISDENVVYNLTPLIIHEQYKNDFIKIIEFLIRQSPNKTVMFLARYQGGEHEIVCGVLSFKDFVGLLDKRKILFNICYIITE